MLMLIVLIDTWWNVNVRDEIVFDFQNQVLIDTWWNVNYKTKVTTSKTASFNRYMVECEYNDWYGYCANYAVLIDTWWNVNVLLLFNSLHVCAVLIDTWWNVNLCWLNKKTSLNRVLIDTWWNVNN